MKMETERSCFPVRFSPEFQTLYIAHSIKVALGIGKLLFGGHSSKALHCLIERFSFECRKVIGFAFTTLGDWLKRFAPLFHPIRSKTKTNCNALTCIFPRFASATCNYFEF